MNKGKTLDNLYFPEEAAKFLRVEKRTLERWRSEGRGPDYVQISGRSVRYEEKELRRWLAANRRRSTWESDEVGRDSKARSSRVEKQGLRAVVKEVLEEILAGDES